MEKPKILLWDLETTPNKGYFWDCKIPGKYLPAENIEEERTIICGSWKWLGHSVIYSSCVSPESPKDDKAVVKTLHGVISQADAIVAHNGDDFDIRWVNARIVYHGLTPLPPVIQIDTKKIAKSKLKLNSYSLDYIARYYGIGQKIKTEFGLWKACVAGNQKALEKMVRYNRHDVVILGKVYMKLAPFMPAKVNTRLFTTKESCPNCGSMKTQHRGFSYTLAHKYRRLQCTSCGQWSRSQKAEKI